MAVEPKTYPSGSFLVGNTGAVQAHTSLDKAMAIPVPKKVVKPAAAQ